MAQQYGFRASNNLSEAENRNACWDNLGINRNDLPLLVGTSAAGVTSADYQAIIGLTSSLESQIVTTVSGSNSTLSILQGKIAKTGDSSIGDILAAIVNNDRPYTDAANRIYAPSIGSFFSPASSSGFTSGAEYKLGTVATTTSTISGFKYNGIAPSWNNYYVKYKQYLAFQEQPSWTVRRSPLYLAPPSQIEGNALWLDSEFSAFVQDGSGVRQWRDVLGRGGAIQDTTANQPLLVPNVLNGKPGVVFDGSNDFLSFGNIGALFPSEVTFIVALTIGEPNARGDTDYNILGTLNNISNRWRTGSGNGNFGLFTNALLNEFPGQMPSNGTYIMTVQASQSLGVSFRVNSLQTGAQSNQFVSRVVYDPGGVYVMGANANGSAGFFTGAIYSAAFFNRLLSAKELRSVEEYFAWRFNYVFDPDRSQTVDLEDGNPLETEGGVAFVLG
jgi:hypothetical protein